MSYSKYTQIALRIAIASALAAAVVAAPQVAFAAPAAPIVSASSTIDMFLPTGGNPNGHDLNIFGAFSGLRPGESLAGYSMWVACDDLTIYNVTLTPDSVTKYPDGTVGGHLAVSFPASEQGHGCRIQTSGPTGRKLLFTASGWRPFLGDWEMDLSGYAVTVAPKGGLY